MFHTEQLFGESIFTPQKPVRQGQLLAEGTRLLTYRESRAGTLGAVPTPTGTSGMTFLFVTRV